MSVCPSPPGPPNFEEYFPEIVGINKTWPLESCVLWYRSYRDPKHPMAFFYTLHRVSLYPGVLGVSGTITPYRWIVGEDEVYVDPACRDHVYRWYTNPLPAEESILVWKEDLQKNVRWPNGPWQKYDDRELGESSAQQPYGDTVANSSMFYFYDGEYHTIADPGRPVNCWVANYYIHAVRYLHLPFVSGLIPTIFPPGPPPGFGFPPVGSPGGAGVTDTPQAIWIVKNERGGDKPRKRRRRR